MNYANNDGQGQDEYYVPSSYNTYRTLQELESYPYERTDIQQPPPEVISQFPSLVNPSILLDGPSRLNKYKLRQQQQPPNRLKTNKDDLNNLLVSLQRIESPENDDLGTDYSKQINYQNDRFVPPKYTQYKLNVRDNLQDNHNTPSTNYERFRQRLQLFQAENMASNFEKSSHHNAGNGYKAKIRLIDPNVISEQQQMQDTADDLLEPKYRRKMSTEHQPSLSKVSHSVVHLPASYQQSIEPVNRKDSLLSSLSDIYFVGKFWHFSTYLLNTFINLINLVLIIKLRFISLAQTVLIDNFVRETNRSN